VGQCTVKGAPARNDGVKGERIERSAYVEETARVVSSTPLITTVLCAGAMAARQDAGLA